MTADRLSRRFYQRDPVTLARALLGRTLVRHFQGRRLAGRIVETEAYLGIPDKAAHTRGGRRTDRNASMWGPAGCAYVYFTYGMHHCLNVVADCAEVPTAVLIRALEPVEGLAVMQAHRQRRRDVDLCSGPAKLTQALAIDRALDGTDLVDGDALWVEGRRGISASRIVACPRIGVAYAKEWAAKPLRFCIDAHPHLSVRPAKV